MLISNQKELERFCASIAGAEFITVDTEFLREKTYYPKLCLVQIADPGGNAAAIDVLADGIDLGCVYDLFFDENILKIFHAARQDLEIFYNLTGKIPQPIFDTQVAAMVCGYGDSVGYDNLIKKTTDVQIDKSSQFTNWSHRPLSKKQIHYAIGDVTHLVHAYRHLAEDLEKTGRTSWVFEEEETMNDPATYFVDPHNAWQRIKTRGAKPEVLAVLRALAGWREQRAQDKDLPRNWVMRDETLVDLAHQMPIDEKGLKKIRNISADMAKGHIGKHLLEIIAQTRDSDPSDWPIVQKKKPLSPAQHAACDILKMLLKVNAAENGVAGKLIASAQDIEAIACNPDAHVPAMRGWRRDVFGNDARDVLNGSLAIGLKDSKIAKHPISTGSES